MDHDGRPSQRRQQRRLGAGPTGHGGPPPARSALLLPPRHRGLELPEKGAACGPGKLIISQGEICAAYLWTGLEIPSLNFRDWSWVRFNETGEPIDPYQLLPPIFEEAREEDLEHLISDPRLADGAAAMVAYARMQFSEMAEEERSAIRQALLKYCELDTLAMVMLWEYWSRELMAD